MRGAFLAATTLFLACGGIAVIDPASDEGAGAANGSGGTNPGSSAGGSPRPSPTLGNGGVEATVAVVSAGSGGERPGTTTVGAGGSGNVAGGDPGGAPPGCSAVGFGDHAYYLCGVPETWAAAEALCVMSGGHLVTIDDQAEDDFVFAAVNALSNDKWWIGFNDIALEGTFVWVDGSLSSYTHWEPGEPNDQGGEDCAHLNRYYPASTWNDEPCTDAYRYICEVP